MAAQRLAGPPLLDLAALVVTTPMPQPLPNPSPPPLAPVNPAGDCDRGSRPGVAGVRGPRRGAPPAAGPLAEKRRPGSGEDGPLGGGARRPRLAVFPSPRGSGPPPPGSEPTGADLRRPEPLPSRSLADY